MKFNIKRVTSCVFVFSLMLIPFFSIQGNNLSKNVEINPKAQFFGSLKIDDNDDFITWASALGWSGNGSINNPYIIEDEEFNGNSDVCLHIWYTTFCFIIRNCTFINSGGRDAISLKEVQNGKLINNTLSDDHYNGIDISYCDNFTISENIASNSERKGILISFSTNITLSDNVLNNNGYGGLQLGYSNNIICMNNTAKDNIKGFDLQRTNNTIIIQNTMKNNSNEGIYISECYQIEILENTITENKWGIWLGTSNNNTISKNKINNNEQYGINLFKSNYNLIKDNNLSGNGRCFTEIECEGNIFENNICITDSGDDTSSDAIPGYYPFIIIGIIFLATLVVFKKRYKH